MSIIAMCLIFRLGALIENFLQKVRKIVIG